MFEALQGLSLLAKTGIAFVIVNLVLIAALLVRGPRKRQEQREWDD